MSERVLILGGTGMFGHRAWLQFGQRFETWTTARSLDGLPPIFEDPRVIRPVEATNLESVTRCLSTAKPSVVINCIGVIKQLPSAKDPIASLTINALFPHHLASICRSAGARLIHLSTDCVFSGRQGMYTEADSPDADDLYGRTKLLGEVTTDDALTIRTSILGRELRTTTGLLEWLLSHRHGRVQGYRRAIFSGLTAQALSALLTDVVEQHPRLAGLYHVASEPINKYDLLCSLNECFEADITIEPSDSLQIDRSLNGWAFQEATQMAVPSWDSMIAALASDPTPYDEWRRTVVC